MNRKDDSGFTLIEMVVTIAVIALLATIAVSRYGDALRSSTDGVTRGNLGMVRKSLSVYYGDIDGQYPADLSVLTVSGRYLRSLPNAKVSTYHQDSNAVLAAASANDGGGWVYDNTPGDAGYGTVKVNCTHTDSKGSVWTSY